MNKISILIGAITVGLTLPVVNAQDNNRLNPAISLILQGQLAHYSEPATAYALPGFMLGGEAGLADEGLGIGHSELVMSAAIDDLFYGKFTLGLAEHEGQTEAELEEAFIETVGLGGGISLKAGRFFSNIGYLNSQHSHAWDFIDPPLVYRALFGNQLIDDGVQVRWLAPSDLFLEVGVEASRGERFPAGGAENDGRGAYSVFAKMAGDVGVSHSWQVGLSHWSADIAGREGGGHQHEGTAETPSYSGESTVTGFDLVWKWAPDGNYRHRNIKFQFEYFERDEDGQIELVGSEPLEHSRYTGEQSGWYSQAVVQFAQGWRAGLRFDRLDADNRGDNDVLDEAGLNSNGEQPKRSSLMIDYARSEFSLIRLQFNRDHSRGVRDDQIYLQYVVSLGAHGAHQF